MYTCADFFLPVYEHVSSPEPGRVDKVVALRDELGQVLPGGVRGVDDQVLLVLVKEVQNSVEIPRVSPGPKYPTLNIFLASS